MFFAYGTVYLSYDHVDWNILHAQAVSYIWHLIVQKKILSMYVISNYMIWQHNVDSVITNLCIWSTKLSSLGS